MASLRVVHVVCTNNFAGAERYVTTLARGLQQYGVSSIVVGGQESRMRADLHNSNVTWLPGASIPYAIRSLLKTRRADLVHAHMTAGEFAAVASAPALRAKVVATRHFAQPRGSNPARSALAKAAARRIKAQLAISEFTAARIDGPSVVVPPSTAALKTPTIPAAQRDRVILVAQRLESEKRTDLAIEAWKASGLADQGWQLQIAGDGAQRSRLEAQAHTLGVPVTFLGARSDLPGILDQAAILLAPRPDEPFGISVIEAMAAGLPVVAAAGGGHCETVGRVPDAALYENPAQGGQLLRSLAEDPKRRDQYAEAERKIHQGHFTVEAQVEATVAVYREVLAR